MQHDTFLLPVNGTSLWGQFWLPERTPTAAICLIHGHGEHSGRYAQTAAFFAKHNIATYAIDCIGHGKSRGTRGAIPSYEFLLDMVASLQAYAAAAQPHAPLFIYGHSMGGNIVANYVAKRNPTVAGVILSAPWLRLAFEPPKIQVLLAKWVQNILPNLVQHTKLDATAISQIPEEVSRYTSDRLVHDCITPRLFFACYKAGIWALDNAEINLPILLQHGTGDRLISVEASQTFAERLGATVKLVLWEGGFHELHHDLQREAFLQTTVDWIQARIASTVSSN